MLHIDLLPLLLVCDLKLCECRYLFIFLCFVQDTDPSIVSEGDTISLNITRSAGAFTNISVSYIISQSGNNSVLVDDISPAMGEIMFLEGERYKLLNLEIIDDETPENHEQFLITLFTGEADVVDGVKQIRINENDAPIRFLSVKPHHN